MSLPIVRLTGSPYDQGYTHGEKLHERVIENLSIYFDRFDREVGLSRDEVLERACLYAKAVELQNPDYHAGMQGIADATGVTLDEIAALNIRYEILYFEFGASDYVDGCTSFALDATANSHEHLLMGQNWDWIPDIKGALLHTQDDDDFATLAFTEAGIFGGKIGLNSDGIGLSINGLTSMEDDWRRFAKPFHVRCYEILRQRTFKDATKIVTDEVRSCSTNYVIGQAPNQLVNIEAAPEKLNLIYPYGNRIAHANHFVDPLGTGIDEPEDDRRPQSVSRQHRLEDLLALEQPMDQETLRDRLRDHDGHPNSICRHPDMSDDDFDRYSTVTSVILDLSTQTLYASDGPPCENPYDAHQV